MINVGISRLYLRRYIPSANVSGNVCELDAEFLVTLNLIECVNTDEKK